MFSRFPFTRRPLASQRKTKSGFSLVCLLLFPGWAVTVGGTADAQQGKPALPVRFSEHITAKFHQQSLKQIITTLDKQASLNILIDGEPLAPLADVECEGTLEEALNKIADTFDYNWTLSKGGIVLFNKRFRNREDVPQASLPEIKHMVGSISEILALSKAVPEIPKVQARLDQRSPLEMSLSEELRIKLLAKKRVTANDLTAAQFQQLNRSVLDMAFGKPIQAWSALSQRIEAIGTHYLIAHRLPIDPAKPDAAPTYTYELVWRTPDKTLRSESILLKPVGTN